MKSNDQSNPTETPAQPTQTLPDSERRALLKRLGMAVVTVPTVTVLHDATRNTAQAY